METFTPIAMRCTQEQFDAVKPKLECIKIESACDFETFPYLINYYADEENNIGNVHFNAIRNERNIHKTWNEEIFLKACGVEVNTLEQQLQKAEAEVKRLKEAIEDSEIKVGDWVKRTREGLELFKADKTHDYRYINSEKHLYQKITDQELINKLNELIK